MSQLRNRERWTNARAAKLFDMKTTKKDTGAARIEWSKTEAYCDWATLNAGI